MPQYHLPSVYGHSGDYEMSLNVTEIPLIKQKAMLLLYRSIAFVM